VSDKQDAVALEEEDHSLGETLSKAREGRGLSRDAVFKETRIPGDYLRMLENDDYSMISDQLYLLPFLRKYATFLALDPEEVGMRFVREVQRIDNNPPPVRMAEPLDDVRQHRRRNWAAPAMFAGLIAVVIGAYIAESRHHQASEGFSAPSAADTQSNMPVSPPANSQSSAADTAADSSGISSAAPAVPVAVVVTGNSTAPTDSMVAPNQGMVVPAMAVPTEPVAPTAAAKPHNAHRHVRTQSLNH
jgi:cytoskeletal protein RodZ